MARQKKQYPPIDGQKRWEKILDWMTREENFRYFSMLPFLYLLLFLAVPAHIATFIMNRPDAIDPILNIWLFGFVPITTIAFVNPLAAGWGLRMEEKLQQPIKEYVEQLGSCTYDELVAQFMPLKIHLGIYAALARLLNSSQLVFECDHYRLPTLEEKMIRHKELLAEYGEKISFSDLEKIFSLDLHETDGGTSIEFSLLDKLDDNYWIWKDMDESSGKEQFFFSAAPKHQRAFPSFQTLADADLFNGKNLCEVWDNAVITFFNDHGDINYWLQEYLHL